MANRRRTRLALSLVCFALSTQGCSAHSKKQQARVAEGPAGERQIDIEDLVADAQSAPSEFAADALMRIVESGRVTDRKRKVELLGVAFRRAGDAQHLFRREFVRGVVDTRPGYLSFAYDLKLDALSLRSRAVRGLLAEDRQKARALLSEIPPKLNLKPLDCDDRLAYNVSDFYSLVEEVTKSSFTPQEARQNLHIQFAALYVSGINSPAQVEPAAKLILGLKPSPAQLAMLVNDFSSALKNVAHDDRSFSYSLTDGELMERITDLVKAAGEQGGSKSQLLGAFRSYLVRGLTGSRCADNMDGMPSESGRPSYLAKINAALFAESPIPEDDIKPASVQTAAPVHAYWQFPEARQLMTKIKRLRFGTGRQQLTVAEKSTVGWELELTHFLNDLHAWDEGREKSEADYFHQKSVLYESLLQIVPPGPAYDDVLRKYVSYLTDSVVRRESRIEWFWHVNNLIKEANSSRGEERAKRLNTLSNSGEAIIRLYVNLTNLNPPKPSTPAMQRTNDSGLPMP